ncbi:hypothetical protein J6590_058098 [Homalodisca vitripennis]|nr:hypothetical protein J6590_058098 [Homalodisca vitripennis]
MCADPVTTNCSDGDREAKLCDRIIFSKGIAVSLAISAELIDTDEQIIALPSVEQLEGPPPAVGSRTMAGRGRLCRPEPHFSACTAGAAQVRGHLTLWCNCCRMTTCAAGSITSDVTVDKCWLEMLG